MGRCRRLLSANSIILALLMTYCLSIQHTSNLEASNLDVKTVVEGNTKFALELYQELKTSEGNLFFSPYSISTALAMTYGGAREETAKQMAETLHFSLENKKLHSAFADIQSKLNTIQRKGEIQLDIANSLWPQDRYPFLKEYLVLTKRYYRTEITAVDYERNPEAAQKKINIWVEEKTNNKIKDIISDPPDTLTRLFLINAIYFKGNWDSQFKKLATTKMPFFLSESKSIEVSMMRQKNTFIYGENESLQILELPYVGDELSMLVLLPREIDGINDLEESLTEDSLKIWTGNVSRETAEVYLPRFRMTSEFNLNKVLSSMGMNDAFDMNKANFSGMDGNTNWLYIDDIFHKAYVDVNEEGTEAAAATRVGAMGKSEPPPPIIFRADHPFLFLIRDNSTESILFMGRLRHP